MPDTIEPTGDDALYAYIAFESGAVGQWIDDHAGHGLRKNERLVYGSKGSLQTYGNRNGRPIKLHLDDGTVDRRRAHPGVRAELPPEPAGGRAVRRRARLDLRASPSTTSTRKIIAARVLRARRVHPRRHGARGDRRGRAGRPGLDVCTVDIEHVGAGLDLGDGVGFDAAEVAAFISSASSLRPVGLIRSPIITNGRPNPITTSRVAELRTVSVIALLRSRSSSSSSSAISSSLSTSSSDMSATNPPA